MNLTRTSTPVETAGKIVSAREAVRLIRDGDMVTICARTGELNVDAAGIESREAGRDERGTHAQGIGRELFAAFRERASSAEKGASFFEGSP